MTKIEVIKECYTTLPVIASFDPDGHIRPLYVKIGEESLKIYSYCQKTSLPGMRVFDCRLEDHGIIKPVLLAFHENASVWSAPDIPKQ